MISKLRPDWAAIKADYLAGNGSFRELAERFTLRLLLALAAFQTPNKVSFPDSTNKPR